MGAAGEVCIGESGRGMFAKVRAKNPFLSSFRKTDEKSQEPKQHGSPSSSPATTTERNEDAMPETIVLLLLDRFAPS